MICWSPCDSGTQLHAKSRQSFAVRRTGRDHFPCRIPITNRKDSGTSQRRCKVCGDREKQGKIGKILSKYMIIYCKWPDILLWNLSHKTELLWINIPTEICVYIYIYIYIYILSIEFSFIFKTKGHLVWILTGNCFEFATMQNQHKIHNL